jgi:hypothetical protein
MYVAVGICEFLMGELFWKIVFHGCPMKLELVIRLSPSLLIDLCSLVDENSLAPDYEIGQNKSHL